MSDQTLEGTTEAEAAAPDGLMAATALEAEQGQEDQTIEHRADVETEAEDGDGDIYERPDWFPEKFWDEKEGPDLENIVKSYEELQKQFSQGKHKAPAEYDMSTLTDAGYDTDDPVVGAYTEWAKKFGINQLAFDELAAQITDISGENAAAMKMDIERERKALGNNADEIIRSNIGWADGMLRKGVISEEERQEINVWGGTAVGQRLMQKVRSMTGDLSQIPIADVAEAGVSEDDFKRSMQSKMADPRYGNDMKFTRDVEKEFERRYG